MNEIPVTEPPVARHETPPPAVVLALTLQRLAAFGVARWAAVLVDEGASA